MRTSCVALCSLPLLVCAQNTTVSCPSYFAWATNSLGQSPCVVGAYLLGACEDDPTMVAVSSQIRDARPSAGITASPCSCSSVTYSVLSVCALCAGAEYPVMWSVWTAGCKVDDVMHESLPFDVPSGTSVPVWAFLDVETRNGFDPSSAINAADLHQPDVTPSTVNPAPFATPAVVSPAAVTTPTSSTGSAQRHATDGTAEIVGGSESSTISPTTSRHSPYPQHSAHTTAPPRAGPSAVPIIAGVLGALAGVAAFSSGIAFFVRRRQQQKSTLGRPDSLGQRYRRSSAYAKYRQQHMPRFSLGTHSRSQTSVALRETSKGTAAAPDPVT